MGGVCIRESVSSVISQPAALDLEPLYQRARIWAGLFGALGLGVLAVGLRWPPGFVIGFVVLGLATHGWWRLRHPGRTVLDSLLADASVIALALLVGRPPGLVVVPPLAYVVVISPLLLSGRRVAWVVLYAVLTSAGALFVVQQGNPPAWSLADTLLLVGVSAAATIPPMFRMLQAAGRAASATEQMASVLREREQQYRNLVDASPMPIFVHSQGVVVYANQATVDLLGAPSSTAMIGAPVLDYVHPDDHDIVTERIRRVLKGGRSAHGEARLLRGDGETLETEVVGIPVQFEGRAASQVVVRDVTAHKRAEQAAEARSEELGGLFSLTAAINAGRSVSEILDGIFDTFDQLVPYDRIEYASLEEEGNVLCTRWVRTRYQETVLKEGHVYRRSGPITASRDPTHPSVDNDLITYSRSKPETNPTRLLVEEGIRSALNCPLVLRERVVGYLFFASKSPNAYLPGHAILVNRVAGQIAGVMEQSRLRDELLARNQELESLNRSRTQFLANVSHELRTPLTAVVGLSSEMRDRIDRLSSEEITDFASMVATSSAEVAGIVDDLLVIARAEAGQLTIIPERLDLAEIVPLAVSTWDHKESERVSVNGDEVDAWADPLRVRQIIRNLCSNAQRYGGSHIEVRIRNEGPTAEISVIDNGPGIPETEQESIFHAYVAAKADRTRTSVGLGLTVSRQLARAMNGDLTYTHQDGESRFTLTLPAYQSTRLGGKTRKTREDGLHQPGDGVRL